MLGPISAVWRLAGGSVLTTRVEQGQRFRQREGLKERSAVVDTVERRIYGAQWTVLLRCLFLLPTSSGLQDSYGSQSSNSLEITGITRKD